MHACHQAVNPVDAPVHRDYTAPNLAARCRRFHFIAPGLCGFCWTSGLERQEDFMANTTSAKKATRKIEARTAVNKSRRSRMRTFVRKVEEAITAGDHKVALDALRAAEPEIVRAAQKGIVHANVAARKVSRLNNRVKALQA
jgi:small subunit ribosomal protein S20